MRIPLDQIHKQAFPVQADESAEWVTAAARTVRGTPGEPTQDPHKDDGAESAVIALKIHRKNQEGSSIAAGMTLLLIGGGTNLFIITTIRHQYTQVFVLVGVL